MRQASFALAGLSLVLVGVVLGQWVHDVLPSNPDPDATRVLKDAYETIQDAYVEPVPSESLTTASVEAMLEPLDRYSVYISPERMTQVEESFEGSFEGIGVTYELIDGAGGQDTIVVTSVQPGGPSAKAGLRAGDRIVRVEGASAVGWSHRRIRDRLKGPKGSTVDVTLRRPARSRRIETTITRDTVPMETVDAAYMMEDGVGYVRLNRFARTTHRELTDALRTLDEEGMTRLVLDLRGNAGGLMSMAERVADEFLVEGQLIVTARSRHGEFESIRRATSKGQFQERPLIVLVDEHSASASEIVAGALQDHDRALLVGRRTFGKGLVQRQFNLRDESGLRLTVARFHTPSGRRLQRTEEAPDGEATGDAAQPPSLADVPDSLVHRTDAGRPVVGGGGIYPDEIVVLPDSSARWAVEKQGLIRSFARQWMDARADSLRAEWEGRRDAFVDRFGLPSTVYPAFVRYAAEHGERALENRTAQASRSDIESIIKGYVGQRLFGMATRVQIQNRRDPGLARARQSWPIAEKWAERYPRE